MQANVSAVLGLVCLVRQKHSVRVVTAHRPHCVGAFALELSEWFTAVVLMSRPVIAHPMWAATCCSLVLKA
eukprot:scaffold14028_cov16-Prasinocladus_malaysianus.AAC.1